MELDDLLSALRQRAALAPRLGHKIKLDLKGEGVIMLDGTVAPAAVSTEDGEADVTLILSAEHLGQLLDGKLNPTFAYMSGKLKVQGSKSAAMQLAALLED